MENSEEAVAKVIKALRDSEPAPGLENRVLRSLRNHEPQPFVSRWRALASCIPAPKLAPVALVMLCAAFLAVLLTYPHIHAPLRATQQQKAPAVSSKSLPNPETIARVQVSRRLMHAPSIKPAALKTARASHAAIEPASQAASFPAPQLPLTKQEKLLLQVARSRRPSEIDPLRPEIQVAQAEREKQEFSTFFKQNQGAANETN